MDTFINLAKSAVNESQGSLNKTGGSELNRGSHGSEGALSPRKEINQEEAIAGATKHSGDSGQSDLFATALNFLNSSSSSAKAPVNEDHVLNAHREVYDNNNAQSVDANALGSAAALQVLKGIISGGGSPSAASSDGNFQTKLIGMAMAEAAKTFDAKGGSAQGTKQDAVNGAAETVIKLLVQSKLGGGTVGGSDSGGLGALATMASKFM